MENTEEENLYILRLFLKTVWNYKQRTIDHLFNCINMNENENDSLNSEFSNLFGRLEPS